MPIYSVNLAYSGAGILAINPAGVWCQTSTTTGAYGGELHKTIQPLKGNISRPLTFMEIYGKKNTDPMNMDALDFDGDMWDPEYCDSELRAVWWWIAGWTLSIPADTAETQSQADGW